MNKKIITAIMAALLSFTTINMAKADAPKPATVAILDTALNANLSVFKDKIVQEVCILEWNSCANGSNFMEGPGAASMPLQFMSRNGFDHGTKMAHASVLTNPNIKIVFVRIIGSTPTGVRQIANEDTFVKALNWVLANKDKFNIKAVALSQSHHNLAPIANYCPTTPNTSKAISDLDSSNIPVFVAAGNMRDVKRISWPSCIPQSIAVSATSVTDGPAVYTNYDPNLTDMFALGRLRLLNSDGYLFNEEGTSVSAQVAASIYVGLNSKYPTYTKQQIFDLMKSKSYPVKSKTILGYIVNVEALNG
jgi:Subtilase family